MQFLDQLTPTDDCLSGLWCNRDAVTSSTLEAVSFVTPVMERFFIGTVADALEQSHSPELERRGREFAVEEARHARAHQRFNASLLEYLGAKPFGVAAVEWLLDKARRRLSLANRLLLAAALEHLTAVFSKRYLLCHARWSFRSDFARELFAWHAHEELAHRSVAFDLWRTTACDGPIRRTLALALVLTIGSGYLAGAVLWILYRKSGRQLEDTLVHLAGFFRQKSSGLRVGWPLQDLFLFTRRDYHPRALLADGFPRAGS